MAIPKKNLYVSQEITVGNFYQYDVINSLKSYAAYAAVPFGRMVMTTDGTVGRLISGVSYPVAGIAMLSKQATGLDSSEYEADDVMAVADKGCVTVYASEVIAMGDTVRVVHTASGGKPAGTFVKTAIANYTAVVSNAKFMAAAAASGVVRLFINAPMILTADT